MHLSIPMSPTHKTHRPELSHQLRISQTKLIITLPGLHSTVVESAKECAIPLSRVLIFNPNDETCPEGFNTWRVLLQHEESDWQRFNCERRARETTACLLSTSGTTGPPKLAIVTHAICVTQAAVLSDSVKKPYVVKRLICLPMFHAFVGPLSLTAPLREGHTTYVMPRFLMEHVVDAVGRFEITETAMVPPMMIAFVMKPISKEYLRNLQFVWCAGAPLDVSIMSQMYGLLASDARIAQVWGLTECGWVTTFLYPEKDCSASVGRLLPNTEAKSAVGLVA